MTTELEVANEPDNATEIAPVVKRKKRSKANDAYYVQPEEMRSRIRHLYVTGEFLDDLGHDILKIAYGLSFNSKFKNYSYREEMVGDALVKMYAALKNQNFRVDSTFNPFSYFTTIAFRAFINRIKKEKKHHQAETEYREKHFEEHMLEHSNVYTRPVFSEDDMYDENN